MRCLNIIKVFSDYTGKYEIDDSLINKRGIKNEFRRKIKNIEERNKRGELDKKWETSTTRKVCIMILTYIVVISYSYLVRNNNNIFLSSLVLVIGFGLSTLSLKTIRKMWENKQ